MTVRNVLFYTKKNISEPQDGFQVPPGSGPAGRGVQQGRQPGQVGGGVLVIRGFMKLNGNYRVLFTGTKLFLFCCQSMVYCILQN